MQPHLFGQNHNEPDATTDCAHTRAGMPLRPKRPRVISASKRTDLPAFYLPRMIRWMEAGWVDVPNPMFRHAADPARTTTHVSLQPEDVRAVVWWSKNYGPYLKLRHAFDRYPTQAFQFTINPRRDDLAWIEPDVPSIDEALRQMAALVEARDGGELISWRYDPVLFWREAGENRSSWDADFFRMMCRELTAIGVNRCFTSIADRYRKFERRMTATFPQRQLRDPDPDEIAAMAREMRQIANDTGMRVQTCSEPVLQQAGRFAAGACIDGALLERHGAPGARVSKAKASDRAIRGREACGCTLHTDIGDYEAHECGYACVYCYANPNHRRFG